MKNVFDGLSLAPAYAASKSAKAESTIKEISLDGISNKDGVSFTPFDVKVLNGVINILRNTDEGKFITSQIFPVIGCKETPELRAKVMASLRKIDAAELLAISEFHKDEYNEIPYDDMPTPWDTGARTDRDRVTLAKNYLLTALGELEKTDAYDDEETRIPDIVRTLESAEDALADVLKDYELGNIEESKEPYWHLYREKDGEKISIADFDTAEQAGHYADALKDTGMAIHIELIES